MKKFGIAFLWIAGIFLLLYAVLISLMYANQEKIIFHANPLDPDFTFHFDSADFEELKIPSFDKNNISGLLFHAKQPSKGLVFYLHGNSGNLNGWGSISNIYTDLGYDLFLMDYRGFGKSQGNIQSQEQVFKDVSAAYEAMKKRYPEDKITIVGYSIGTGPAAWLASKNHPRKLMLQAPYFDLESVALSRYPFVPAALLLYKFETAKYIAKAKCPITIVHGDEDYVVPYENGVRLSKLLKPSDRFITLHGAGHLHINKNKEFQQYLPGILK